jgi:hypothetical protein
MTWRHRGQDKAGGVELMPPLIQTTPGGVLGALVGLGLMMLLINVGVVTSPFDFADTWLQAWLAGGLVITGCSWAGWGVEMALNSTSDN